MAGCSALPQPSLHSAAPPLLGRAARGVTQWYVHVDESVRMAADRVACEISRLIDGTLKTAVGTMAA